MLRKVDKITKRERHGKKEEREHVWQDVANAKKVKQGEGGDKEGKKNHGIG